MRCGSCRHEWCVSEDWLERFEQAEAACPVCGTDCCSEDRPDFCAAPEDQVHDDTTLCGLYWYHSSAHENWPDLNFDPAAGLTSETRRRMKAISGSYAVERWAERQKAKALHLGTYEAAIENMFRRMRDQSGSEEQFYLYRVQLDPSCVVEPGIHPEPTNWLGDAYLADVCSPGANVLRYVNVHEDKSSVSLAVEPSAIRAVQKTPVPLSSDPTDPWIASATQRLLAATSEPRPEVEASNRRWRRHAPSPLDSAVRALELEIAERLPRTLRERFSVGLGAEASADAQQAFPMKLAALARLVTAPESTLEALNAQPWHLLVSSEAAS